MPPGKVSRPDLIWMQSGSCPLRVPFVPFEPERLTSAGREVSEFPSGGSSASALNSRSRAALASIGWGIVLINTFLIDHFELFGLQQVWCFFAGRSLSLRDLRLLDHTSS